MHINSKNQYLSIGILIAGLFWIWFSSTDKANVTQGKIFAPQTGFYAPDFSLPAGILGNDTQYTLENFKGQVVLLNFWASWCPPCKAEMPAMENIYKELSSKGFTILAINVTNQDSKANALNFYQANNLSFPILFDIQGEVASKYQVRSLPTSFFIDQNGLIQHVVVGGPMSEGLIRSYILELLEK